MVVPVFPQFENNGKTCGETIALGVRTKKTRVNGANNNNKRPESRGKGGKNNRRGPKKPQEKKPATSAEDLDKEMDKCKHI